MKQPVVAIIIARGGSIRVPRKNVKPFCGHPLVAWTIVQAQCSREVDYVYVSTDDDEIAEIALDYGAQVIRRPDWPDADKVAANRPYMHAIEVLEPIHGLDYIMVQLFPTSPLRKPDDIDRGVQHYRDNIGGQGSVIAASHRRETFIAKNIKGIALQGVLEDKFWTYMDPVSGLMSICNPRWYQWHVPKLGSDLDADLDDMYADGEHFPRDIYYVTCEPWQVWEVDTPVEFSVCELLMEHFLPGGLEQYKEYANGK